MFGCKRERMLEGLLAVEHELCCYMHDVKDECWLCDCKYGRTTDFTKRSHEQQGQGERTGHPEVGFARRLIGVMSHKEYDRLAKRYEREQAKKVREIEKGRRESIKRTSCVPQAVGSK